jgi:serine/threonine-protein kinase
MELATGTTVDRYTVDGLLGEGGMAVVYACHHAQLGTRHALKLLTITSRSIRERLVQEGKVQASLRHPNVVAVTDVIVVNGAPGLVMEYIDGPSLDQLLDQQRLSFEQIDHLVEGLLAGVGHAHAAGLVHRDLKPANIMLAAEGDTLVPKVMDFGLAKVLEGDSERKRATRTGSTMGTPQYMSPEQVEDSKNVDHRTDVFACGAILYEMVTGHRAFSGDSLYQIFGAVAEGRFRNPRELCPDLPRRMEEAIVGALKPDRDARIATVAELLDTWRGHDPHAAAPATLAAGPFTADFVSSVRSMSTEATVSQPDPTFALDAPPEVETLHTTSAPSGSSAAAANSLPARSMVRGTAVVMGGGALMAGLAAAGVALLVVGVAGGVWWASTPPAVPVVEASPPTVPPSPRGGPVPVASAAPAVPKPAAPVPTTRPEPVVAVGPVPGVAPDAPVEPVEPVAPDEPAEAEPGVPPEPDGSPVEVPPASTGHAGLDAPDAETRISTLDATWSDTTLASRFVDMARNDPDLRVREKAWAVALRQYNAQRGAVRTAEPLIVEAVEGKHFDRYEAIRALGRFGNDPRPLVTPVVTRGVDNRTKKAAVDAMVSIGQRGHKAAAIDAIDAAHRTPNLAMQAYLGQARIKLNL